MPVRSGPLDDAASAAPSPATPRAAAGGDPPERHRSRTVSARTGRAPDAPPPAVPASSAFAPAVPSRTTAAD
jgi:hypothetical protein